MSFVFEFSIEGGFVLQSTCGFFFLTLHAILEALDCFAQIASCVAQFFGTENQYHHDQQNNPMR